jgi:hypothetical protein
VITWSRGAPAALLFAACASAPDLRYASADPADTWESGVRWHASAARSLACSTAYAGPESNFVEYPAGRTLVFQVRLGNHSDTSLRVDPLAFRAYAPRSAGAFPAADPESALVNVDGRMRDLDFTYGINLGVETARSFSWVVLDIAGLFADPRSRAEAYREQSHGDQNWNEVEDRYQKEMARLKDERSYWERGHLRRTDLAPGRVVAGAISIPFPADSLPPDTLVLQWTPAGGRPFDLGRYGRPRTSADTLPPRKIPARPTYEFIVP